MPSQKQHEGHEGHEEGLQDYVFVFFVIFVFDFPLLWRDGRWHAPLRRLLERIRQFNQPRFAAGHAGKTYAVWRGREREAFWIGIRRRRRCPGGGGCGTNKPKGTITVG
jgi:hypothetical protein